VFFGWLNDSGHASTTRTRPSAGFFVSGWRFALARLAPEAGNTPVSNRIIPPSVEGYAEGYVLNVGLEGSSQNRQEAGFSFLVRGTLAGQCGTQRERKQEEDKTGKGLI
jgi:hypothetical protein